MQKTETIPPARGAGSSGYAGRVFGQIQKMIEDTGGQSGALIRVLQQAQGIVGYLPPPVLKTISRDLKIPMSEINGIVSFYHFFTTVPRGKYTVQVCLGTCCYVRGGQAILDTLQKELEIEAGGTTRDMRFSLDTVRCLGCCGLSPVVAIEDTVYRRVRPNRMREILKAYA